MPQVPPWIVVKKLSARQKKPKSMLFHVQFVVGGSSAINKRRRPTVKLKNLISLVVNKIITAAIDATVKMCAEKSTNWKMKLAFIFDIIYWKPSLWKFILTYDFPLEMSRYVFAVDKKMLQSMSNDRWNAANETAVQLKVRPCQRRYRAKGNRTKKKSLFNYRN